MRFEVPTHYETKYLLPKKRNEETAVFSTVVSVDIREVPADEAPIVHVLGEMKPGIDPDSSFQYRARYQMIDAKPVEIRSLDDELYVQIASVDTLTEQLKSIENNENNVFSGGTYGDRSAGLFGDKRYYKETLAYSNFQDYEAANRITGVRKVVSLLNDTVQALQKYADDLAIIDGFVYEKTVEPALLLTYTLDGKLHLCLSESRNNNLSKSRDYLQRNEDASGMRFGLDEFDRAVAEGKRIAKASGIEFVNRVVVDRISPWEVEFRGDLEMVYNTAKSFVHHVSKNVRALDKYLATAWYDMSMAVAKHHQPTDEMIDAMRRVEAANLDSYVNDRGNSEFSTFRHDVNYACPANFIKSVAEVKEALRLWDSRTPGALEWLDTSLNVLPTYSKSERAWEVVDCHTLRDLALEYDTDLSEYMATALEGRGSIVVISPIKGGTEGSKAIVLVETNDNEPRVATYVTRYGTKLSDDHVTIALHHVSKGLQLAEEKSLISTFVM